ncbi:MAG: NAD(P)H-hydrate epimerase, partial [Trueperaceae bacterium]|nr:NAD(P)H-hydrate epimerase [Trueperaceae bacterium]
MKLYHAAEMREADERAAAAGVSGETLMENAGAAVAREVLRRYPGTRRAVILCGKGNNGGDGYVCARKLRAAGLDVKVLELRPEPNRTDAARARTALLVSGAVTAPLTGVEDVRRLVAERTVIVDALLGSGLDRSADGWLGGLLSALSGLGAPVVAIDVPSGLPTDTPRATGPHVTADVTVELAGRKVGGAFPATSRHYGVRVLAPIGMPSAVLAQVGGIALLDAEAVRAWLPARERSANKYTAGTVTVVAGSGRYAGAAELACRGAWRAGAGLVTLVGPERHPSAWPETIFERAEAGRARGETMGVPAGTVPDAVAGLIEPKRAAALVIGPGLAEEFLPHLPELLTLAPGPVVLDAAALGALAAGTIALG